MIMQSPVAMSILKEPNHIIEIANDKQLELWGRSREEVMNRPFFEAIPEATRGGYEEVLRDVYSDGKTISGYEIPIKVYREGTVQTIYAHVVNQPYKELDGKISGVMIVDIDVTDQVLARQKIEEIVAERTRQLAEANNALQQNNRELEQFAYVAAHDLQEPLRTISNFVGLFVKKYGISDPETETYIKFILNATSRMQSLIKDLLDFSRTGRNSPFEMVNLNKVLQDLLEEMDDTIKANNATVNYSTLPVINGIENELKRLFQNLISNAIKFKKENVPPVIDILLDEKESEYIFMIRDNGIGFEEKYKDKLFIIFQRLHTTNEYPGTGIGLAICKKIVTLHGGKIWVKSKPGKGSSFYFCIPKGS
jgi:PAS domain S-box-containing protein